MKFVLFHNAADDSYMNTVENFRGAYAATETVDVYFNAVGNGREGAYDKITVACTNGEEDRAVEELANAMTRNCGVIVIADDVNSVYACQNITAVSTITLAATGNFMPVEAITVAKALEVYDSGKLFTVSQASGAYNITLPTVAQAGAGWNATFVLVAAASNAVAIINDATEDKLIGVATGADGGAGTASASAVDSVTIISGAEVGDMVTIMCDGNNFYVNATSHDAAHITID